jgi:hypothetical protein
MNHANNSIGIDIGRVLICPTADDGRPDTSFLGSNEREALAIPPAAGAFSVVRGFVERYDGRVWLVSKAGQRIENLTRLWLEHHDFYRRTGMAPDHVRFCRRRPEKREHALELGLTHFIDDRLDVLGHMVGVVPHLLLFGWQPSAPPHWVVPVADWSHVERRLLPEIRQLDRDQRA